MLRPQGIPPGHTGKLMRLPFTTLTARRNRALGFSRPSLACFRNDLGHGLMPPEPVAQSGSACTAGLGRLEKSVLAVVTPVLSKRVFGNGFSPYVARKPAPAGSSADGPPVARKGSVL